MKEKEKRLNLMVTPCFRFGNRWEVGGGTIQTEKTFISVSQSMSLWEVLKCSCPKPCLTQNIHAQAQPWMFSAVSLPHVHFAAPNPGLFLSCWYLPVLPSSATSATLCTKPPYPSLGRSLAMTTPSRWAIPETVYILKQLESLENFQQRNVMWSDSYFKGSWIGKRLW